MILTQQQGAAAVARNRYPRWFSTSSRNSFSLYKAIPLLGCFAAANFFFIIQIHKLETVHNNPLVKGLGGGILPQHYAACDNNQILSISDKVDIVIPWVNYTNGYFESLETPFDYGEPIKRLYDDVGLRRKPFTEICYTIRSHLYYDINNQIDNIYIVYNKYRHDPPDCGFEDDFPQVIYMPQQIFLKDVPTLNHPNMSSPRPHAVFPYIHRIPNLRPYFLFVMDDIFLLREFDLNLFYDFKSNQIISHLTRGLITPSSKESIAALKTYFNKPKKKLLTDGLHVPYMLQRCRLQEVEEIFSPNTWKCSGPFHLCNYPNVQFHCMVQNYQLLAGGAQNEKPAKTYKTFAEIHVEMDTQVEQLFSKKTASASWIDIQGYGVSDEYVPKDINIDHQQKAVLLHTREVFDNWLQRQSFYQYDKHPPSLAVNRTLPNPSK